jgi:hypothetical protein
MLHAVKGQVWFTETGGIVHRTNRRKVTFRESAAHAATATRFLFRKLVPLSRRVTRVYIYQWNANTSAMTWDSALIGPTGHARPAYKIVARELHLAARRRAARAAKRGQPPPVPVPVPAPAPVPVPPST